MELGTSLHKNTEWVAGQTAWSTLLDRWVHHTLAWDGRRRVQKCNLEGGGPPAQVGSRTSSSELKCFASSAVRLDGRIGQYCSGRGKLARFI